MFISLVIPQWWRQPLRKVWSQQFVVSALVQSPFSPMAMSHVVGNWRKSMAQWGWRLIGYANQSWRSRRPRKLEGIAARSIQWLWTVDGNVERTTSIAKSISIQLKGRGATLWRRRRYATAVMFLGGVWGRQSTASWTTCMLRIYYEVICRSWWKFSSLKVRWIWSLSPKKFGTNSSLSRREFQP